VVPKSCPSGASLVGPKMDLPMGGENFETASLLLPCVYQGLSDTVNDQRRYYKLSVPQGQTLKVVMRTRDIDSPNTEIQLHGPDGGSIGGYSAFGESVATKPLEYKADESATVFISLKGGIRGAAIDFSVR